MKNTWKGLVIGGLTGVLAGLILDALSGAAERAERISRMARERGPELAERARLGAERAAEMVRDADLKEKARVGAERAAELVRDADLPEKARHAMEAVRDSDLGERARVAAERVRDVDLREAAAKGR